MIAIIVPLVFVICAVIFGSVSITKTDTHTENTGNFGSKERKIRAIFLGIILKKIK